VADLVVFTLADSVGVWFEFVMVVVVDELHCRAGDCDVTLKLELDYLMRDHCDCGRRFFKVAGGGWRQGRLLEEGAGGAWLTRLRHLIACVEVSCHH